jgi:hypothetical protein
MFRKFTFILLFYVGLNNSAFSQEFWTIGPMIHVNFGGEKTRVSYAVEVAYWNLNNFYHSVDGGLEFESKRIRIYSELQTGFGLAGIGFGPLLEFNMEEGNAHIGFQGTLWGNYFLGFDYRKRWINKTKYNCGGIYVKVPFASSGTGNSSGNSTSHFDWDD